MKADTEELILLNCGVGEDSWESLTERRSNQSILKEISPEYSLEGLMQKLKLQYFGHLMQRADSLEKTLMLGKIEGRRRGRQRMRWLDGITNSMDTRVSASSGRWWRTAKPGVLQSMELQRVGHDLANEQQQPQHQQGSTQVLPTPGSSLWFLLISSKSSLLIFPKSYGLSAPLITWSH